MHQDKSSSFRTIDIHSCEWSELWPSYFPRVITCEKIDQIQHQVHLKFVEIFLVTLFQ